MGLDILRGLQAAGGLGGIDALRLLPLQPVERLGLEESSTLQEGEKRLLVLKPLCEGPDLPQLQLLLGHPGLHGDGSSQLGRLLLLGSQGAGAKAFSLRRWRFCLREAIR